MISEDEKLVIKFKKKIDSDIECHFSIDEFETIITQLLYVSEIPYLKKAIGTAIMNYPEEEIFYLYEIKAAILDEEIDKVDLLFKKFELSFPPSLMYYLEKISFLIFFTEEDIQPLLDLAFDIEKNSPELLLLSALNDINKGQYESALQMTLHSLTLDIIGEDLLENMSVFFTNNNNLEEGITFFKAITDYFPYCENAWCELGKLNYFTDNFNDALTAFLFAYTCNNQNLSALLGIGNSYAALEDYDTAINYYFDYIKVKGSADSLVYSQIGDCYFDLHWYDQAMEYYQKTLDLSTDSTESDSGLDLALLGIISILKIKNRTDEILPFCIKIFKNGKEISSSTFLYILLNLPKDSSIDTFYTLFDNALLNINNVSEIFDPLVFYAIKDKDQHKCQLAIKIIEHYESIIDISNNDFFDMLYYYRAAIYFALSQTTKAKKNLQKALCFNYDNYEHFLSLNPEFEDDPQIVQLINDYK